MPAESTERVHFSMRLTPREKAMFERLAAREGTSQKEAVLRLVRQALDDEPNGEREEGAQPQPAAEKPRKPFKAKPGSVLEGLEDIVGSVSGPPDLSSNPKYMEDFGKD